MSGLPVNTASRKPGASAVIYSVADEVPVHNTDIRLFSKPESNARRRMGVALAFDADVDVARVNAKKAAGMVKPRAA